MQIEIRQPALATGFARTSVGRLSSHVVRETRLQLVPNPPKQDLAAVIEAVARVGPDPGRPPGVYASAWRAAALAEGVDRRARPLEPPPAAS